MVVPKIAGRAKLNLYVDDEDRHIISHAHRRRSGPRAYRILTISFAFPSNEGRATPKIGPLSNDDDTNAVLAKLYSDDPGRRDELALYRSVYTDRQRCGFTIVAQKSTIKSQRERERDRERARRPFVPQPVLYEKFF